MPRPATSPTPSLSTTSAAVPQPSGRPVTSCRVSASVRITAIGSFRPDSSSRVAPTRRFSWMPLDRRMEKTAAASVDETMAPRSRACSQGRPSSRAKAPTSPAVASTPAVASAPAGARATRKDAAGVLSPPSKRMRASATVPSRQANA